jgi:two-component system, LytTR family, sensor kinase
MEANIHLPLLLNTLGHVAGAAAFSVFLFLLWRSHRRDPRGDVRVPAAAASLALFWNVGSLAVLVSQQFGYRGRDLLASLSFAVLSLLPSVLLDLSLAGSRPLLRAAGYCLGIAAFAAHLSEGFGIGVASHQFGLLLSSYGFGALAVIAALALARDRARSRGASMRVLAAMSLFLFAISFVHFSTEHGSDAWTHEVLFHHAGIPLALFILLQDYRFLLLDVFVRLIGSAVLAIGFAAGFLFLGHALGLMQLDASTGVAQAALISIISVGILLFPRFRDRLRRWAEAAVFRRGDVRAALEFIRTDSADDEAALLDHAARRIAGFAKAKRWRLIDGDAGPALGAAAMLRSRVLDEREIQSLEGEAGWAEAAIPLRLAGGDVRLLLLGGREQGRRYLSEDLDDLDRLAAEVAGQIETKRRDEYQRLVAEAELDALRAQINPHFLFNALNALYGVIPRSAAEARTTLVSLAEVFRYALQSKRQFVSLDEELRIVEAYLQIERLRLGRRLRTEIYASDEARFVQVPVLSIQPLVENAVKHGVSAKPEGGLVRVDARVVDGSLRVEVTDDGPGFDAAASTHSGHGLQNVRRRIQLCYQERSELAVKSSDSETVVGFTAPLEAPRL